MNLCNCSLSRFRVLGLRCLRSAGVLATLSMVFGPLNVLAATTGVSLADSPLFSATQVPANLLLELSVEYPTALSIANSAPFQPTANTYVGYFDPNLCYTYVYSATDFAGNAISTTNSVNFSTNLPANNYYLENAAYNDSEDYFKATSRAGTNGTCSNAWSGAFLNWAGMQTIDPFRWALTGGYRSYDTTTTSILKKAWANGSGGSGETPVTYIPYPTVPTLNVSSYTPFNWPFFVIRVWGLGTRMQFTWTGVINGNNQDTSEQPWTGAANQYDYTKVYSVKMRVKACDNSFDSTYTLPSWCTQYGSNYKPEGLIQQYSTAKTVNGVYTPPSIRFGAMGYLNDSSIYRDAGVLRARMAFLGPTAPTSGDPTATNTTPEWDPNTGVYFQNPDSTDLSSTNSSNTCTLNNVTVQCANYSGVINYLNGFGEITHTYKTYDPVSELYYAGIRYFKTTGNGNLAANSTTGGGNVPSWSDLSENNTITSAQRYTMIDQFPVIQTWSDPILYACQKNFVLGIGDVNTHASGNIAGSPTGTQPQNNTNYEPTYPSAVAADNTVASSLIPATAGVSGSGAVGATNYIGLIESNTGLVPANGSTPKGIYYVTAGGGYTTLGQTNVPWCCYDDATYLMAGLAYDAHTTDMRPGDFLTNNTDSNGNKLQIQTLTTYWLDVQENQTYRPQNQFWLAAKYGGFTIPEQPAYATNYVAYQSAFPGTTSWSHTTDAAQPGGSGAAMPDNYYGAGNAQAMVSGLSSAFASIATSASATTTGLVASNYNIVSTTAATYSVSYDESTWSSDVIGYTTTFSSGTSVTESPVWDSKTVVSGFNNAASPPVFQLGQFSINTSCTAAALTPSATTFGWKSPAAGGRRVIATYNPTAGQGVAFEYPAANGTVGLSSAQVLALEKVPNTTIASGQSAPITDLKLLDYLRGDQCQEAPTSGAIGFRQRVYLQGDVVNSSLVPVGAPSESYTEGNDPGFTSFATANANRATAVYVGGNDGMLHAYNGELTPLSTQTSSAFTAAGGSELFAYIPSATFAGPDGVPTDAGLAALANPQFVHHYYVDATPVVEDVDLLNTNRNQVTQGFPNTHNWISLLVGGLGKGGQSFYALNVTNPTTNASSESALAANVLWEFTQPTMGYSFGQATIAKTAKYGWVVILTSGMTACQVTSGTTCSGQGTDTSGGHGYIYFVNPATGALLEAVSPGTAYGSTANPEGLTYASGLQSVADGTIDALYFADLLGNLFRLDLTCTSSATGCTGGTVASGAAGYAPPVLFAKLTDSAGNAQPVTTRPIISVDPTTGNRYVSVGTGQLLSTADLSTTSQQTFYTFLDGTATTYLPDNTPGLPITRTGTSRPLQTLNDSAGAPGTVCGVKSTSSALTLTSTSGGWYFDLAPSATNTSATCRVNVTPLAGVQGTITFAANVPSGSVCNPSGSNEVYAFATSSGMSVIDVNGSISTTGITIGSGEITNLNQTNSGGSIYITGQSSNGGGAPITEVPPTDAKLNRLNWREVPADD